ncbi:hypothetical protein, partial [Caldilinea sp.]|uniref:hypothetical protein n=1 Tax=Caldilinea sp. TaxID=2293560 RepID=UPI002D066266|nr:hypothetical protein [Caldilinea sp.]
EQTKPHLTPSHREHQEKQGQAFPLCTLCLRVSKPNLISHQATENTKKSTQGIPFVHFVSPREPIFL